MGVRMLPGWDKQAGLAVPSRPSGSWELDWEGEAVAVLGWFSCGEVNRHRKQLPGILQAGSGLPASPGQPALLFPAGSWRGLQTLCRHGLVAGDISGSSLGLGQGLNPILVPFHQLVKNQQYVVLPNLPLPRRGRQTFLPFGRWQQGTRERAALRLPGVNVELSSFLLTLLVRQSSYWYVLCLGSGSRPWDAVKQEEGPEDSSPPTHPGCSQTPLPPAKPPGARFDGSQGPLKSHSYQAVIFSRNQLWVSSLRAARV